MTRTAARQLAVHMIFSLGFADGNAEQVLADALTPEHFELLAQEDPLYAAYPDEKQEEYIRTLVTGVAGHAQELDQYISRYSVGWNIERIPRTARAILRTALYEVLYMPDVPNAAALNAAVEIAKEYETAEVVSFLNGILGSFMRAEVENAAPETDGE